jgi:acyl carrier protein
MSDTNPEIFERFKATTVKLLAVTAEQVTPEASFADDLEADSLDLTELVMALEEEFDIEVDEDELEDIRTVGDAYSLIERLVVAKS